MTAGAIARERAQPQARAATTTQTATWPWQLVAVVFAATSVIVGLIWDISWHMTIGRDTFWTPAHLAIYTGGAVAGLACGVAVMWQSFGPNRADAASGVTIWHRFRGPLGGWVCIWGAIAMLTSAPFDDWWHDAYGLDVAILSPPHAVLAAGFLAILVGALLMSVSSQSRSESTSAQSGWVVAYAAGLVLVIVSIMATEFTERVVMHTGRFYAVSAFVFPLLLLMGATAARLKYPATAMAAVYMLVMMVQGWILPLFPGEPLLGPIRREITHMVPMNFPLLLIVPALAIDLVLRVTRERGAWLRAALAGVTFVVVFAAVQWPFASFLMSDGARNALFFADNFPYMMPDTFLTVQGRFVPDSTAGVARGFGWALVLAVLSSRAGIAWGTWLRSVRR